MGFVTRVLIPRKVRRIAHPVRAVKRTVIPRPIRQAQGIARSIANPISAAGFAVENAAVRAVQRGGRRLPSGFSTARVSDSQSARARKLQDALELASYLDELAEVHQTEFPEFVSPESWDAKTAEHFRKQVEKELLRGVPFWRRSQRAATRAAVPTAVQSRLQPMIQAARALQQNSPEAVLYSLAVAFADNEVPAVPVSCERDEVAIALLVRDVDALLGNRRPSVTKAGNPSLATWAKRDRNDYYVKVILSEMVATAREAFANAPGVGAINMVVIRRSILDDGSQAMLDVVMHVRMPRSAIQPVNWSTASPIEALGSLPMSVNMNSRTHALDSLDPEDDEHVRRVMASLSSLPT